MFFVRIQLNFWAVYSCGFCDIVMCFCTVFSLLVRVLFPSHNYSIITCGTIAPIVQWVYIYLLSILWTGILFTSGSD